MSSIATKIIRNYDLITAASFFLNNHHIPLTSSCLLFKHSNFFNNNQTRKMSSDSDWKSKESIYEFSAKDIDGNDVSF